MSTTLRRLWWAAFGSLLLLMVIGACDGVPTATPSPTPTPTPVPLPLPILANLDEDPRLFFEAIPQEEQECLASALGQARLDDFVSGRELIEWGDEVIVQCISEETFARTMLGVIVGELSALSDETLRCLWSALEEADLKGLFTGEVVDEEAQLRAIQAMMKSSLCLTEEEAARVNDVFGLEDFSLVTVRCLASRIDERSLETLITTGQPSFAVISAMLECGLEMGEDGTGSLALTPEELACVVGVLGEQGLEEIVAGQRIPTLEEILGLARCDLDLERLLETS